MVKFTAPQEGASQNSSRGSIGVRQPKSTRLASYNEMATSSSSDDELDDGSAVKIVKVGDATMTLELVLPVGTHPGQPIEFVTPAGKVKIIVPSGVMPRRKFRVDVVPGSVADATLPSRSTHSSDRAGSTDDRSDSSDDGLADADESWSRRREGEDRTGVAGGRASRGTDPLQGARWDARRDTQDHHSDHPSQTGTGSQTHRNHDEARRDVVTNFH